MLVRRPLSLRLSLGLSVSRSLRPDSPHFFGFPCLTVAGGRWRRAAHGATLIRTSRVRSPPGSSRLPPGHDALMAAFVTRRYRRNDVTTQQRTRRAVRADRIAAVQVRARTACGVRIIVRAVDDGESVGPLGAHFYHILVYRH